MSFKSTQDDIIINFNLATNIANDTVVIKLRKPNGTTGEWNDTNGLSVVDPALGTIKYVNPKDNFLEIGILTVWPVVTRQDGKKLPFEVEKIIIEKEGIKSRI
ncbi:MAG: hypothetical protein QQN41_04830 [Nitrosopumilus sp.]